MGAIQSSINSMLGTVAAGTAAAKHMKDKALVAQEQGLLAKEQFHEASADIAALSGQAEEASKLVESTSKAYDDLMAKKPGGKGNTKASLEERRGKALTEKQAAERAFAELSDRIEAKTAMKARAELIMKRTNIGGRE